LIKRKTTVCPVCGKTTAVDQEPAGPFCSERCRLLDLGNWLGERYRITSAEKPEDEADDAIRKEKSRSEAE